MATTLNHKELPEKILIKQKQTEAKATSLFGATKQYIETIKWRYKMPC